jgi:hypothetical protein
MVKMQFVFYANHYRKCWCCVKKILWLWFCENLAPTRGETAKTSHQMHGKLQAFGVFEMAHLKLDFSTFMTITP